MIRTVLTKGREYYVITTPTLIDGVEVSVQVHIETTKLPKDQKRQVYRYCHALCDKLTIELPKKNPWYKFW